MEFGVNLRTPVLSPIPRAWFQQRLWKPFKSSNLESEALLGSDSQRGTRFQEWKIHAFSLKGFFFPLSFSLLWQILSRLELKLRNGCPTSVFCMGLVAILSFLTTHTYMYTPGQSPILIWESAWSCQASAWQTAPFCLWNSGCGWNLSLFLLELAWMIYTDSFPSVILILIPVLCS